MVVDAEPVTALVDAPKLERVLENLLMNASKHTPRGTRLTVRIRSAGEEILMAVEDEGSGVPDDLKPTVFEPFERGIDPRSPGSGIGLAIVKGFTELQGGRVEVADRPGGGASFRVFLRVCPDPLEALAPERDTEIQTASPAAAHE